MNPPPLPSPVTQHERPQSSFGKVLAGLLVGIAPLPLALLAVALVSHSKEVDAVVLGLFIGAAICSLIGGVLVAVGATAKTGARIVIAIAVAFGLFAMDVTGGIFFGCLIVMGKGI